MDTKRLMNEILEIQKDHPVHYDLNEGIVDVGVRYPAGWTPGKGIVRLDAPNAYPREPPTVFIPDEFDYRSETELLLWSVRSGWHKLCIHTDWDPHNHGLATWLRVAMAGLANPNDTNPWEDD